MQAAPQRPSCNGERRSIGRLKYTLVAAIAVAAAGVATSQTASAAKLTWKANPDVESNDTLFIFFEGPIAAADVSAVKTLITKYPKHSPKVILDSEGGDIEASMAIGRMLSRPCNTSAARMNTHFPA